MKKDFSNSDSERRSIGVQNLLDKYPHPSKEEIKVAISGNLCRCTGYQQVVEAIEDVAKR